MPHLQCQPWWKEVPSPGAGIVVPFYERSDGFRVRFSAARGCWAGVWPDGNLMDLPVCITAIAAMNAVDDDHPRCTEVLQRPVSVAISPHNETLVLTDAGRFYWLRVAMETGVPRPYWDELKLPPLPTVFE